MKVLVVRFSSIGDIVLTTPVVRCLNKQLGATIHFLTKKSFVNVIEDNPYIDKIYSIEKHIDEVKNELIQQQYDYVIDLHGNLRTLTLKHALKTKSFTFEKLNLQKWLLVNTKINRLPNIHIVDRYLDTVKKLNISNDGQGLDFFLRKEDQVDSSIFCEKFITIAIGAQHFTKQIPESLILEIIQQLGNFQILLIGGPGDTAKGDRIVANSSSNVLNLCGKYNLKQSASIVSSSTCLITADTGMMHIAAALKVKIVSIWGSTVPAFGMYPYMDQNLYSIIQNENLSCRPCSKIGFNSCPKKHFNCMKQLNATIVVNHLYKLLN